MNGLEILFASLAVLTVASGALAVLSRQVVHAALWLVVALGSLAGVYLVLGAEVVALIQLLIYVGAVVVLLLFALMLTRAPIGRSDDLDAGPGQRILGVVCGVCLAGLLAGTLLRAADGASVAVEFDRGNPTAFGEAVFGGWLLPFELLSVLLLAALVAALVVARGGDDR